MILTCLWWPLLSSTRTATRARSSAPTLSVAPEPSSALERHAPWWWRPRRRHSTQSPPHSLRSLLLSQLRRPHTRRFKSRNPATRRQLPRRPKLRLNQRPGHTQPRSLAEYVPRAVQARPEAKAVLPCRLANPPMTLIKIRIRRNVVKTSITDVKPNL